MNLFEEVYTVEPPVSGHPRDLVEVSTYGRCPLTGDCMSPCKQWDGQTMLNMRQTRVSG